MKYEARLIGGPHDGEVHGMQTLRDTLMFREFPDLAKSILEEAPEPNTIDCKEHKYKIASSYRAVVLGSQWVTYFFEDTEEAWWDRFIPYEPGFYPVRWEGKEEIARIRSTGFVVMMDNSHFHVHIREVREKNIFWGEKIKYPEAAL